MSTRSDPQPPTKVPLVEETLAAAEELWAAATGVTFEPPSDRERLIDLRSSDPWALRHAVSARGRWLGGVDERIAASSFVFAYTQTLLLPAMATLVTAGVLPDLSAANCLLSFPGPDRGILWLRSYGAAAVGDGSAREPYVDAVATRNDLIARMVRQGLDQHLSLLVNRIASSYRLSARVLRTNIASKCWWQFGQLAADPRFNDRAVKDAYMFHSIADWRLSDTGELIIDGDTGERIRFERSNCCLIRLIPGEETCVGCSWNRRPRPRSTKGPTRS